VRTACLRAVAMMAMASEDPRDLLERANTDANAPQLESR
jgi:hypothetical protein